MCQINGYVSMLDQSTSIRFVYNQRCLECLTKVIPPAIQGTFCLTPLMRDPGKT